MLVLTFQVGANRLALDVRQVREVVPRVVLDRPAGKYDWLAGLFVYRGRVVPVIDLHHLLGAGECPLLLSSRIILVPLSSLRGYCSAAGGEEEPLLGLLAAQVADIREADTSGQGMPAMSAPGQPDLGMAVVESGSILHLLDMARILPEPVRRLVEALPSGESAG